MELTIKERIQLINQYNILASLNPSDTNHYEELIEILENGYEIFYSQIEGWVSESMPSSEGKFVLDVLSLYRAIEDYKRQNPSHALEEHHWGHFVGFDGNNETAYMGFARFLIHKQKKFSEQKKYLEINDDCNSHSQTVEFYKRMLVKWEEMDKKFELNDEEVHKILGS